MYLEHRWERKKEDDYLHVLSDRPMAFDVISEGMNPSLNGKIGKALSNDGIAFWADREPQMSSIISVELEDRVLANCSEVEYDVLCINRAVVGKVSSVEHNERSDEVIVKIAFLKRNGCLVHESKRDAVAIRN